MRRCCWRRRAADCPLKRGSPTGTYFSDLIYSLALSIFAGYPDGGGVPSSSFVHIVVVASGDSHTDVTQSCVISRGGPAALRTATSPSPPLAHDTRRWSHIWSPPALVAVTEDPFAGAWLWPEV